MSTMPSSAPESAKAVPSTALDAIRPLQILLVEDQIVTRKLVTLVLEKWGHRIQTAENGNVGLECFMQGTFDLVLMDLQMPVMDGFAATKAMRDHEAKTKRPRTTIIAMTGHTTPGDRDLCIAADMDDYLPKPFAAPALLNMLRERYPAYSQNASAKIGN